MTYSLINHQFVCWLNPVNVLVLCPYLLFYLLYPLQNVRVSLQRDPRIFMRFPGLNGIIFIYIYVPLYEI